VGGRDDPVPDVPADAGQSARGYISEALSAEQQNLITQQFGLDRPLWNSTSSISGNLLRGELGTSFHRREPVLSIVLSVLPNTIILTFCGLFIAYAFGILAGAFLAWHRGTWIEGVVVPIALRRGRPPSSGSA
jgi:peptide/nickel transport system permease protein